MKRSIVTVLGVLLGVSLIACGSSSDSVKQETEETKEQTTEQKTEPAEAFSPISVIDYDSCSITLESINPKGLWGYTVKAVFENRSADTTYMFAVESASINDVVSDPFFAEEVAAGKKSNSSISFPLESLQENGVGDVTDIEMTFRVYDSDDWEAEPVAHTTVHVYPLGEDAKTSFVYTQKDTDRVIADNDDIAAIVTGYTEDDIWGYSVNLYFVNKTDRNFLYSAEDVSVNGMMADPFFAASVPAHKSSFTAMSWSDTAFEENNITDVEEIEFRLVVRDADEWDLDPVLDEVFTWKP